MTSTNADTAAVTRIPPWLSGHDVLGYAKQAQLKFDPVDLTQYSWRIEALERHEHRSPRLIELIEVAAPGAPARWETLSALPMSPVINGLTAQQLAQKREQLLAGSDGGILPRLNWLHLSLSLAPDTDFIEAARGAFETLSQATTADDEPFFPELAAYFIRFDQALNWRTGFARVMLRVEEEPDLLTTPPQQVPGQLAFGLGTGLMTDLPTTRDAYLAPLFLCHSPWIWAIVGQRQQGVMVFSLGRPLRGREADPAELVQQFMSSHGLTHFASCPPIDAKSLAATLTWWVEQLNAVLSVVTDPATFADRAGQYRPRRQFEALLNVEQVGRRIQTILAHQRDQPTRRVMAFAALDSFSGIGGLEFDKAVEVARARKTLERLETTLPSGVADVLLPTARRAVEALRECQDGFFPSERVVGGQVKLPHKNNAQDRTVTIEEATARYLRVLRNANHGFGGKNDSDRRRDEVLLSSHTGDIPDDLTMLPYLYWLDTLAQPETLRQILTPR